VGDDEQQRAAARLTDDRGIKSPTLGEEHEMDWVDLFTGFHGRISRQPFWIGVLVLAVVEIACQAVALTLNDEVPE